MDVDRVILLANKILDSKDFEAEFLKQKMTGTNEMTNEQILFCLRRSAQISLSGYTTWRWWSSVVGYFSSGNTLYCNLKYWNVSTDLYNASFVLHEYSHFRGFSHQSATDYTSVPYTINKVVELVGARIK